MTQDILIRWLNPAANQLTISARASSRKPRGRYLSTRCSSLLMLGFLLQTLATREGPAGCVPTWLMTSCGNSTKVAVPPRMTNHGLLRCCGCLHYS